ncbi:MAG: helix-turn-helix domain-containing protein [Candidatus Bathyarchaeia archaeon]
MKELENIKLLHEHIQTLTQLGLSHRQAKVYLALLISGMSTAKTISQVSKVPRQDVYTVVAILEKMGLCEEAITRPVMFRATPLQKSIDILMQRKTTEYDEIRIKTKNLLKDLKPYCSETTYREEKAQFLLLSERQTRVLRIEEAVNNAANIVDSFTTPEIFRQVVVSSEEVLKKAARRGVRFRFLMENTKGKGLRLEIPRALLENPCFEVRYATPPIPAAAVMIDQKEIFFGTAIDFQRAVYLWTDNAYFVGIIQNHFELIWNLASKVENK